MLESDNIFISVVMPAYNAGRTIRAAIRSVQEQTWTDWELLVADDGSEDLTRQIVREIAGSDGRVRLLEQGTDGRGPRAAGGAAAARNRGVRAARGPWVAFLDSDDLWEPEKLEKQIALVRERQARGQPPDIVFTGCGYMDERGRRSSFFLHVPEEVSYRQLLKQNVIGCSTVLIRRERALENPMPSGEVHEDYVVWLRILRGGGAACGIDEPLMIYRLSSGSKSGDKRKAAAMTCRSYREAGLGRLGTVYYFLWYAVRNIRKYALIRRGMKALRPADQEMQGEGPQDG